MQISVVTGSMARPLQNIIQEIFLFERGQERVQPQGDPDVLGARVLTEALADPFPDICVHCACPVFHGPVPHLNVCLEPCAAELLGDDASIEPLSVSKGPSKITRQ